ncbi:MAG: restriction endonuclease subunit S [Betaproteobacteria bacterium]|nr:restriction endonuclease subunit S [Betaproteobacteria bacterium]
MTWRARSLGEVLRIEHGYAFKGEHFADSGKYVVLTPGNFHEQGGFRPRPGKDRFYSGPFPDRYLLKKDDIIVAMTEQGEGLLGSAAIIPDDDTYLHNQRLGLVREQNAVADRRFLYYLFNSDYVRQQIRNSSSGAKVRHTSPERMYAVKIHFPDSVAVQRKVAAILSAYDDLIANNQRRIALLESMAEEIYREWFVRMRFPCYEDATFSKGRPKAWKEGRLGDIADFTMGQSPSSEFYNERGDGLPFHQGVGTYGPRFPRHVVYCSVPGRSAKAGDILFSVRAPVGRMNIADRDLTIGRGLAAMRHREGANAYLFYLLHTCFATEDLIGNGSIFNSVGKDELARFPIIKPDDALVEKFDCLTKPIGEELGLLYETVDALQGVRDRLLPRLISGKLKVDHLDIRMPPSMREVVGSASA